MAASIVPDSTASSAIEQELAELRASLAILTHDLRGPLTVLVSTLPYIDEAADVADRDEMLADSRDAVRRLNHLLDNVSAQQRLERGELVPGDTFVADAVERAVDELRDAATVRNAKVVLDISSRGAVTADESALRRMTTNLLANAIEYSPMGGQVVVRLAVDDAAGEVVLSVADQGPAIAAEHAPHVFDAAEMPRLKRVGIRLGKGATLIVARMVADQHDGSLRVHSDRSGKRGATFVVRIPLRAVSGS